MRRLGSGLQCRCDGSNDDLRLQWRPDLPIGCLDRQWHLHRRITNPIANPDANPGANTDAIAIAIAIAYPGANAHTIACACASDCEQHASGELEHASYHTSSGVEPSSVLVLLLWRQRWL